MVSNKKKKKYIYMWFASVVILSVDLFLYCYFIMSFKTVTKMVIDLILLAIGVSLQIYARKKLTYKEGYTAIQAIQFYKKCLKENITTQKEAKKNIEKITEIAKSSNIKVQDKTINYLDLFQNGKNCYKLIKK